MSTGRIGIKFCGGCNLRQQEQRIIASQAQADSQNAVNDS
ncbi:hypothetical protein ALO_16457 [Acetonema longum DSM 6540]|uniref:Uncharacterized protein n=1 Tax=Acetonema longum DSM 6540 TaxID=1009370 RepID=F7NMG1_9FIRM|nr:hypothetical protein ALO_16457 [Acetonema longum DSM 6540]